MWNSFCARALHPTVHSRARRVVGAALAVACLSVGSTSAIGASSTYWQGPVGVEASWSDPSNWSGGFPDTDAFDPWVTNGGIAAVFAGDSFAPNQLRIGNPTDSFVRMYGGELNAAKSISVNQGSFVMTGGVLDTRSFLNYALGTTEFRGGTSNFVVTLSAQGGTTLITGSAAVATDGSMKVGSAWETALVQQDAGSLVVGEELGLGISARATGRYELSGGTLESGTTRLGFVEGGGAIYDGHGTFVQTGGSNTINTLDITMNGLYEYSGGTLTVDSRYENNGTFDFLGSASEVVFGDTATVDLRTGTVANAASATFSGGANAIVLVPVGFDPSTVVGNYQLGGVVVEDGSPVVIDAGTTLTTAGTFDLPFTVRGTLDTAPGSSLRLVGGVDVESGGSVTATDVVFDGVNGSVTNGTFKAADSYAVPGRFMAVGEYGTGVFTQTNSDVGARTTTAPDGRSVLVGAFAGSDGTYNMVGGSLIAGALRVGHEGKGVFNQTGGLLESLFIFVGDAGPDADGTYILNGGTIDVVHTLSVAQIESIGRFEHRGGAVVNASKLDVGGNQGAIGTYVFESGSINVGRLQVGLQGETNPEDGTLINESVGRFEHTGGVVNVSERLSLGQSTGGVGTYVLSGGTLNAEGVDLGDGHDAHFDQSAGVSNVATFDIARGTVSPGGNDVFATLSGGEAHTGRLWIGDMRFVRGGYFEQTAGTHTVNRLYLGVDGEYRLHGGLLVLDGSVGLSLGAIVGDGTAATFQLADGGYADFDETTFTNVGGIDFVGGTNSLVTFAAGVDPTSIFASFTTAGIVHVAGQNLNIASGQGIGGTGEIDGSVVNAGSINPGNSPGLLSVLGDFDQLAEGSLTVELAGTDIGNPTDADDPVDPEFDRLVASGAATLSGELVVVLLEGYIPDASDAFVILSAASVAGQFTNAIERVVFNEGSFAVTYNASTVVLSDFQSSAIPTPGSFVVMLGLLLASAPRRRRVPRIQ